jgi:hypothetical protein
LASFIHWKGQYNASPQVKPEQWVIGDPAINAEVTQVTRWLIVSPATRNQELYDTSTRRSHGSLTSLHLHHTVAVNDTGSRLTSSEALSIKHCCTVHPNYACTWLCSGCMGNARMSLVARLGRDQKDDRTKMVEQKRHGD